MKLTMANLIIAALLAQPVVSHAENRDPNLRHVTIFDEDDRVEAKDATAVRKKLAESTVALFASGKLRLGTDDSWWITKELVWQPSYSINGEKSFAGKQLLNSFGSGVLVGDDLILTAGHLFWPFTLDDGTVARKCGDIKFVFGYKMLESNNPPANFLKKDVYDCKEIIKSGVFDKRNNFLCYGETCQNVSAGNLFGPDYALVRLDRKVENNAQSLAISRKPVQLGDDLFMIGYPSGMLAKVSNIGKVVVRINNGYFMHTVDTLGGNSGSPVFDAKTLEIEGIHVRGAPKQVSNYTADVLMQYANHATSVLEIADLIPETQMERDINAILERKAQRRWEHSGNGYKPIPAVLIPGAVNPVPAVFHPSSVPEPQPAHGI